MKPIKICNQGNLINFLIAFFIIVLMIPGCDLEHTNKRDGFAHNDSANLHLKLVRTEIGEASWYGPGFHGKKTASGEIFDQKEMTAAHPSLPMGTEVKVTNLDNGEKIKVKINDRGPYAKDRIIDLSHAAAKKLDMENEGTAEVKIEVK